MNLTDFSLRNRTLIIVLTLGALYAGFQSFNSLPRLEDPEFTIKEALVITPYPGATPYEVEEEVSDEIEQRRTSMPVVLMPGERTDIRVFVPVAPSPRAVRLIYRIGDQAELLEIDTSEALAGLHFADPNAPTRRPQEGSL